MTCRGAACIEQEDGKLGRILRVVQNNASLADDTPRSTANIQRWTYLMRTTGKCNVLAEVFCPKHRHKTLNVAT